MRDRWQNGRGFLIRRVRYQNHASGVALQRCQAAMCGHSAGQIAVEGDVDEDTPDAEEDPGPAALMANGPMLFVPHILSSVRLC